MVGWNEKIFWIGFNIKEKKRWKFWRGEYQWIERKRQIGRERDREGMEKNIDREGERKEVIWTNKRDREMKLD